MSVYIERWDGQHHSACRIFDIVELCHPLLPKADRAHVLNLISSRNRGYENSAFVAWNKNQICGFAMIFRGPVDDVVKVVGAVDPEKQNQGVGTALLKQINAELTRFPYLQMVNAEAFESCSKGIRFIKKAGFTESDRLYWNTRSVDTPFPKWAQQKILTALNGFRFMRASEFENIRTDWDLAWYRIYAEIVKDIPSTIRMEAPPFDIWRKNIDPPIAKRSHIVMALVGQEPVGSIWLGDIDRGKININHTGVAASHRRSGLSLALKFKAFELAKQLGAHSVTTQNHHHNPMRELNQRLGFKILDVLVSFTKAV